MSPGIASQQQPAQALHGPLRVRIVSGPVASGADHRTAAAMLQPRDLEVVRFLDEWGCASRDQLVNLFFPSTGIANRRLHVLVEAGLLERVYLQASDGRPNVRQPAHYILGPSAPKLIRSLEHEPLRRGGQPRLAWLACAAHSVETVECLTQLASAARAAGHRLLIEECVGSERLRRDLGQVMGRNRVPVIPDGYLVLQVADQARGFFLEVDRGRERGDAFALKARGYRSWWSCLPAWRQFVQERRLSGDGRFIGRFPPVLVVTTGERRMRHLMDGVLAAGTGPVGWHFTYWRRLAETPGGWLSRVWQRVPAGECSLIDLAQ